MSARRVRAVVDLGADAVIAVRYLFPARHLPIEPQKPRPESTFFWLFFQFYIHKVACFSLWT